MQCEQNTLNKLCYGITEINDSIKALDALHKEAEALDGQEQANKYAHEVVPAMDRLRAAVDAMEEIVARDVLARSRLTTTSCSTCNLN